MLLLLETKIFLLPTHIRN